MFQISSVIKHCLSCFIYYFSQNATMDKPSQLTCILSSCELNWQKSRSLCEWCVSPRVFCCCEQDQLWYPQPVYRSRSVPAWSRTVWQCTPAINTQILNSLNSYTHRRWDGQMIVYITCSTLDHSRLSCLRKRHCVVRIAGEISCKECFVLAGEPLKKERSKYSLVSSPWRPRLCRQNKALLYEKPLAQQATTWTESVFTLAIKTRYLDEKCIIFYQHLQFTHATRTKDNIIISFQWQVTRLD